MNAHDICRQSWKFEKANYIGAMPEMKKSLKGIYFDGVTNMGSGRKKYYVIRWANGEVMWDGYACCKWEAKVKAINKVGGPLY